MVVITYLYYTSGGLLIFIHVHGVMSPSDMMPCVKTCFQYVTFLKSRHDEMLCFHARLFVDALWSPAGKGLTCCLSFVMSNCDVVTFPLVSWVRCGAWLYRFLIFARFLTIKWFKAALNSEDLITIWIYSKTCVKRPLSKRPQIGFPYQLSLNACQKYCRMLQGEHSAILSTFNKLPFVI